MGITNLISFVKNACRPGRIRELEGQTVAIDISCLLHKGLFGCVEQVANGLNSKNYLSYVNRRVQALLSMNCHVILVFDGAPLPAKKNVNDQRRDNRMENMRVGTFLLSQGKKQEAVVKLQKAVSLTRDVIEETIETFNKIPHVDVIIAPYEADAQLAFLLESKMADVVITEDSDLIVFGCSKIIFKWDFESETCSIYEKSLLPTCFTGEMNKNFDFKKFRRICILSGCDYLQNGLPGVGLSKSYNFFSKTTQTELEKILPRIPSYLKMPKLVITNSFVQDFIKAEQTFLHQIVFDPRTRQQRPLHLYENTSNTNFAFAGSVAEEPYAIRHSLGNIISNSVECDKFTLPDRIPSWSLWSMTEARKPQHIQDKEHTVSDTAHGPTSKESIESTSTKTAKETKQKQHPLDTDVGNEKKGTTTGKESKLTEHPLYTDVGNEKKGTKTAKEAKQREHPLYTDVGNEKKDFEKGKEAVKTTTVVNTIIEVKNQAIIAPALDNENREGSNASCRYFKRRTSSCSNPFKKPKIDTEKQDSDPEQITRNTCGENDENILPTNQVLSGFRFSGLRRKPSVH